MRFSIIGNNPPQKLLDMAINDDRIKILGYVDDVRPFFESATISVCPIRDGGGPELKFLMRWQWGCLLYPQPLDVKV